MTHGYLRASDQERRPRRSRDRSCYRSSKLVMRVRFPSPAPIVPAQVRGMIIAFRMIFTTPGCARVPVASDLLVPLRLFLASRRTFPMPGAMASSRSRVACS